LFLADGQTDMTKIIVAIRNFAKVPKNERRMGECMYVCMYVCVCNIYIYIYAIHSNRMLCHSAHIAGLDVNTLRTGDADLRF